MKLALPALSIPLADPIMSLVDSLCIGRYSTTLDLAALGPNLVIFNFVSFTFTFLAITTTIRASTALAKEDVGEAGRAISTSSLIALVAGIFFATLLFLFPGPALATTGAIPEILASAVRPVSFQHQLPTPLCCTNKSLPQLPCPCARKATAVCERLRSLLC